MIFRKVVGPHYYSSIGEGPHWDVKSQCLLYVDINKGDIYKWNTVTNDTTKLHLDGTVGFVTPRASGGLLTGLSRSLVSVNWDGSDLTTLGEIDQGTKNRFNDGKCDPSGRLWAGTMGFEPKPAEVEFEMGTLYSLEKDGAIKPRVPKVSISNGLAWSLDNTVMYYIDSIPRKVFAFDFDISTGNISNRRTAVDTSNTPVAEMGVPDGMCSDADGKLWVAMFGGGRVVQFDPDTGKEMRKVNIPASRTTSCCFGGPNLDELYVTCANFGLHANDETKDEPLAGSVFKVTGLGVKGTPMYDYAG